MSILIVQVLHGYQTQQLPEPALANDCLQLIKKYLHPPTAMRRWIYIVRISVELHGEGILYGSMLLTSSMSGTSPCSTLS